MKKTVLLLTVCLVLGLCACGLRGQSTAGNTVEPVHFSAPAVRQDPAPAANRDARFISAARS